jgi:polysaccharide export outer membrane protein
MVVGILFCFGACSVAYAQDAAVDKTTGQTEYRIGAENALQIDVYYGKNEKISQKVRVSSRGVINFPLVGEVEVVGLTVSQLQDRLKGLLEKDYLVNPQVTIYIEEYSTVSIMGEVKKPGAYPIKGRLTVVELISLAEGFSKIAAPNKVKVVHTNADGTKEESVVKVYDLMNKESGESDRELRSGDVVIVPESLF